MWLGYPRFFLVQEHRRQPASRESDTVNIQRALDTGIRHHVLWIILSPCCLVIIIVIIIITRQTSVCSTELLVYRATEERASKTSDHTVKSVSCLKWFADQDEDDWWVLEHHRRPKLRRTNGDV